ncbi:hypothetical protein V499_04720 [Pseudogymnoascus sp. VKM F-103]|nr:hypothetical protein V499_04720 [Pseudogymnoascus sp. VKM F-103]
MGLAEKAPAEHQTLVEDCHISRAATMDSNDVPQNDVSKSKQIEEACQWKDTQRLRDLALSEGGLVSDDMRRKAWPILLGFSADKTEPIADDQQRWQTLPRHADEDQVQLDVNRAFIYYPTDQTAKQIDTRKGELSDLITEVLRRQPYLCYFQGYHDICQVFLLVLGNKNCSEAVSRLSTLHIRDFMLPTLAPALAQLRLIPGIIRSVNPKLYQHLSDTQPFFALSGTLTIAVDFRYSEAAGTASAGESSPMVKNITVKCLENSKIAGAGGKAEPQGRPDLFRKTSEGATMGRAAGEDHTATLEEQEPSHINWSRCSGGIVVVSHAEVPKHLPLGIGALEMTLFNEYMK